MDAPSQNTIDALLAELVPTARLDDPPAASDAGGHTPAPPPNRRGGFPARRRRRWPTRLALIALSLGLVGAMFAAGVLVGRRTADGPTGGDEAARLASTPGQPFGTASLQSELGDAEQSDPTGLVARYRDELAARDLVSTSLGDDDLTRFGYAACVFAASAEGPADFDRFRATAAADAETSLSDAEMEVVIDTAVLVFCPVDAQRLGITA